MKASLLAAAAVAVLLTPGCNGGSGPHEPLTPKHRIVRRLDSMDLAIQSLRTRGAPVDRAHEHAARLADTLHLLRTDSSFKRLVLASAPPVEGAKRPNGALNWLVGIMCAVAIVAAALAARAAATSKRTRATRTTRQARDTNTAEENSAAPSAPSTGTATQDPAVQMVRTKILHKPQSPLSAPKLERKRVSRSASSDDIPDENTACESERHSGRTEPSRTRSTGKSKAAEPGAPAGGAPSAMGAPDSLDYSASSTPSPPRTKATGQQAPSPPRSSSGAANTADGRSNRAHDSACSPASPSPPAARAANGSERAGQSPRPAPRSTQRRIPARTASTSRAEASDATNASQQPQRQPSQSDGAASAHRTPSARPPRADAAQDDPRQRVAQAAADGKSVEDICREFGLSTDHVRLILKMYRTPPVE